jgi:hypothetical protein
MQERGKGFISGMEMDEQGLVLPSGPCPAREVT